MRPATAGTLALLLAAPAIAEDEPKKYRTVLGALEDRQLEAARALLPFMSSVNAVNEDGNTALCLAAPILDSKGHWMVRDLLNAGADVNAECEGGMSALHFAVIAGRVVIIDMLLDRGADVNAAVDGWRTPVAEAYMSGDVEVAEYLESRGGYVEERIKIDSLKQAVHVETNMRLILEMPKDLSPEDKLRYRYEASLTARAEALKLETNPHQIRFDSLWLQKCWERAEYDPNSGISVEDWYGDAILNAMVEASTELEESGTFDAEKMPKPFAPGIVY